MTQNAEYAGTDWPTTAGLILRLSHGWELFDDHGTWRWYKETKPGFDDELPTEAEIAFLRKVNEWASHNGRSES